MSVHTASIMKWGAHQLASMPCLWCCALHLPTFWSSVIVTGEKGQPVASVALLPRSLLVFSGEAYEQCLHGIDEVLAHFLIDRAKTGCSPIAHSEREREKCTSFQPHRADIDAARQPRGLNSAESWRNCKQAQSFRVRPG